MGRRSKIFLLAWLLCAGFFVVLGFGSDNDSWRLARAAERIWTERTYVPSRSTGFPLYEILLAPLVHFGGWYLSNMLSLLSGVLLLMGVFRLSRGKGRLEHPGLVMASIALSPYVIASSTSTIDYVPALALLLWSYAALLEERYDTAAVLAGLAVGFRPTSGLFVIPIVAYMAAAGVGGRVVARVMLVAVFTGTVVYSPALVSQGFPRAGAPPGFALEDRVLIAGYNALALVGIPQSLVVYPLLLYSLLKRRQASPVVLFHVVNVLLWIVLFALLPSETEYLLPLFLSLVLLLDMVVGKRAFLLIVLLLASFNLVQVDALGGRSGRREIELSIRPGITVLDAEDRMFKLSTRRAASAYRTDTPTVLMYGEPWIPTLNAAWTYDEALGMYKQREGNLYVSERIVGEKRIEELKRRGFELVAWEGEVWEYYMQGKEHLLGRIEVVQDLETFFGVGLKGRALNQR